MDLYRTARRHICSLIVTAVKPQIQYTKVIHVGYISSAYYQIHVGFLLGLYFYYEDGSYILLRNVG
jgi:hypothetical protein